MHYKGYIIIFFLGYVANVLPLLVRNNDFSTEIEDIQNSLLPLLHLSPSSASTPISTKFTEELLSNEAPTFTHDFTDCCEQRNVTLRCIGFCNLHNILDGTTGIQPERCEHDFPSIVNCMADGRNHLPCCKSKGIPDICQDFCRGEYTPFNDYLKSRVSCVRYTLSGLQCISEGIEKLPSRPTNVYVEPLTEDSIEIGWEPPVKLEETVKFYKVNLTELVQFNQESNLTATNVSMTLNITVPEHQKSIIINNLKLHTVYLVTVTAYNDYGSSLPSTPIRTLTLDKVNKNKTNPLTVPKLPDTRKCCESKGVRLEECLNKMCDPKLINSATITDFLICSPWSNVTFSCLTNGIDHTSCCKSQGIQPACLPLCSINTVPPNFNLFKCLDYKSEYSNCLLQGYGVVPGLPFHVSTSYISSNYAVIKWDSPKILADTVKEYQINFRKLGNWEYSLIQKKYSPAILENLDAGAHYEVFVTASNSHGIGSQSSKLIFRTKNEENIKKPLFSSYNITQCCFSSGLLSECATLCSYDLKLSDLQALGLTCQVDMGTIVRCAAGGRDHSSCCNRRGVPSKCTILCKGVLRISMVPPECLSYVGNILQCFEEGTTNIPEPISRIRAIPMANDSISISWLPKAIDIDDTNVKFTDFLVQYGKIINLTTHENMFKPENELITKNNEIILNDLETDSLYQIQVVSRGKYGSSLPSSLLIINTTNTNLSSIVYGAPSAPHSLIVTAHSSTWITILWQPPEFLHPRETVYYKVYYKIAANNKSSFVETRSLSTRLNKLSPSSQYMIHVEAIGTCSKSLPSEILAVWTDPASPAFVDPPIIQPSDIVVEGSSMTILCSALGSPVPTISLYVGGHLIRQDTSRHMLTVIHNVSTDMENVSCYADNGYGTPMQTSQKINVNYSPKIRQPKNATAYLGEEIELNCVVKAKPEPKITFWRDYDAHIPITQGDNYNLSFINNESETFLSTMTLHITKLQTNDTGNYFCHAENALGFAISAFSVKIRNTSTTTFDFNECCSTQNISSDCVAVCDSQVEFDMNNISNQTECTIEYDKFMKCAANESDHSMCCGNRNVDKECQNWCKGESNGPNGSTCALEDINTILDCFHLNRDRLPGTPRNLAVNVISDDEVLVRWDPPIRNPLVVKGYQILHREIKEDDENVQVNFKNAIKINTQKTSINIDELERGVTYELMVKSVNLYGSSVFTNPIRFTLGEGHVTSATYSNAAATISGIVAGVLAICLAITAIFFYKRKSREKTID